MKKTRFILALIFILVSCYAFQKTKEDTISILTQKAIDGNASMQFELGKIHYFSDEDLNHFLKAHKWLSISAKQGNNFAKHYLGKMYYQGFYVPKNKEKAKQYISESIDSIIKESQKNNPEALYCLAWSYYYGLGVEKNVSKAVIYFKKAAKKGHAIAQYNLGICYIHGTDDTVKDYEKSIYWIRKASNKKDPMAELCLISLYKNEIQVNQIQKKYFEVPLEKRTQHTKNMMKKHKETLLYLKYVADKGNPMAQYSLAVELMYSNEPDALYYLYESARQRYVPAQYLLGNLFCRSPYLQFLNENSFEAVRWLRKAAHNGHPRAQAILAEKKESGFTDDVLSDNEAVIWLERAAAQGVQSACSNLAWRYYHGKGVKKDLVKAYLWQSFEKYYVTCVPTGIPTIREEMTEKQIEEGELLLKNWVAVKELELLGDFPFHYIKNKDLYVR